MRITSLGDAALLVEYEPVIDVSVNAHVLAASDRVRQAQLPGVRDVVPAYASFAVHFDPLRADVTQQRDAIARAVARSKPAKALERCLEIPVCYGGRVGPDLAHVAAWSGCGAHEVVASHAAREYRVFMLGFLPGFPYMGTVDERIAMPRRAAPRPRVPAGSVGIAGRQTGIYPFDSPGGWQIIGRTPVVLFDPRRDPAALLSPGQRVRFRAIPPAEFDALRGGGDAR
jgi:KipI family sensor histidine kinase inhibitor